MRKAITQFLAEPNGSAMLEYALILSAIAIGVLSATSALGETLGEVYQTIISGIGSIGGAPVQ